MKKMIVVFIYLLMVVFLNISLSANDIYEDSYKANLNYNIAIESYAYKNYKKAFDKFQLAAKYGKANANFYLSACYEYGDGVKKNMKKALYYAEKGAKLGDRDSIDAFAQYYMNGKGGVKDYAKAISIYKKNEKKDLNALMGIGLMYYYGGHGIQQNKFKAYEYWLSCAKNTIKDKAPVSIDLPLRCEENLGILCGSSPWACK